MTSKNRVIANAINARTAKNATARNGQLSGYIANAIEKMKDAAKLQSSEDLDGTVDAARIAQTFIEKAVDGGRRKFRSDRKSGAISSTVSTRREGLLEISCFGRWAAARRWRYDTFVKPRACLIRTTHEVKDTPKRKARTK